jgi:hypothetical protein
MTIHCKIRQSRDFSALHLDFQKMDHRAKELGTMCGDIVDLKDGVSNRGEERGVALSRGKLPCLHSPSATRLHTDVLSPPSP